MAPAQRRRELQEAVETDDFLREQATDDVITAPAPPKPETAREVPPVLPGSNSRGRFHGTFDVLPK